MPAWTRSLPRSARGPRRGGRPSLEPSGGIPVAGGQVVSLAHAGHRPGAEHVPAPSPGWRGEPPHGVSLCAVCPKGDPGAARLAPLARAGVQRVHVVQRAVTRIAPDVRAAQRTAAPARVRSGRLRAFASTHPSSASGRAADCRTARSGPACASAAGATDAQARDRQRDRGRGDGRTACGVSDHPIDRSELTWNLAAVRLSIRVTTGRPPAASSWEGLANASDDSLASAHGHAGGAEAASAPRRSGAAAEARRGRRAAGMLWRRRRAHRRAAWSSASSGTSGGCRARSLPDTASDGHSIR